MHHLRAVAPTLPVHPTPHPVIAWAKNVFQHLTHVTFRPESRDRLDIPWWYLRRKHVAKVGIHETLHKLLHQVVSSLLVTLRW